MTKPGRIPCITPTCKRTAPADKYPEGTDIICGKCFRALPAELRYEYQRLWREYGKWERRVTRTSDEIKIRRMKLVLNRLSLQIDRHWRRIHDHATKSTRPAGVEAFLEEIGMTVDSGDQ